MTIISSALSETTFSFSFATKPNHVYTVEYTDLVAQGRQFEAHHHMDAVIKVFAEAPRAH